MRITTQEKLDRVFIERWSPRALSAEPIAEDDIKTLFEAARWSPSCFNEQPWRFIYASTEKTLASFRAVLNESNQQWASRAPLLVLVFSKRRFTHNDKPNRWADFDAGAAWMALTLQANKLGLYTHGMAGFDVDKAYNVTGVSAEDYNAVCAVAVGRMGDPNLLSSELASREKPSDRKSLTEIAHNGIFTAS